MKSLRDIISSSTPILLPIAIQMDTFLMTLNLTLRSTGKVEGYFHTFDHVNQEAHHTSMISSPISIVSSMAYQLVTFRMTLNFTFKVKGHFHTFGFVT